MAGFADSSHRDCIIGVMRAAVTSTLILIVLASACARAETTAEPTPLPVETTAPAATASSPSDPTEPSPPTSATPSTPAPDAGPRLEAGDHEVALRYDGIDRRYFVHVPPELESTRPPLIIALHGGGGTAAQLKAEIGLDEIADREGFVVVYPDGTGPLADLLHTWNSGFNCCGPAQRNGVDDVGFIRAVVADLMRQVDIDADRVAVTGHSNGAMMAYRVAAEASDLVSVAVPVAGAMALDDFAPTEPVAILHVHSVDDPRALYEGGEGPPFPGTNSTVVHEPVADGIAAWVGANGCDPTPAEVETGTDGDQSFMRFEYSGCVAGGQISHIRLSGVGHGWPGVATGRERLLGPSTTLVDASEEVWAFASEVWGTP
jgi:polyhydroxybutyrate depolymerase